MNKFQLIVAKLKLEWKTFVLAVGTTIAGAWELASAWGADVPSFFNWVPENLRSYVLFAVGVGFLALRRYQPTVHAETTQTTSVQSVTTETTAEPEATVKS